jgi:integrase
MAHALQRASNDARGGIFTEERARVLVSEIMQSVNGGEGVRTFTVREWFEHFCKVKLDSQAGKTAAKYAQLKTEFLEFLGGKTDLNILTITSADVRAFRDHRKTKGLTATTLNDDLTILSAIFNGAWRDHVITNNPCTAIEPVKDVVTPKKKRKQPFTIEQIKALLAKANVDWRGLILTAFYSGARLDNCANLRWRNVDYQKGKITFERYSKKDDEHEVPLHEALSEHLLSLKTPKKDDAYLFPSLSARRVTNLSKEFRKLMAKARIANWKVREKGKGAARDVWALGFHSFRRSNVSTLANAGVPEERRMALTAHTTREVHKGYTTHEFEVLRKANALLPRL